jgi:type IV pilus assembly protein PilE
MQTSKGFTLIELMAVVAIVAIIGAIALPSYTAYVMRSKITEATSQLANYRVQEEQYYQDNRMYGTAGACGITPASAAGTPKYFTFTCTSATPNVVGDQTYTITATGGVAGGDQAMVGFVYTINQTNAKATAIAAPANTAKWGTGNVSCWIVKPQSC